MARPLAGLDLDEWISNYDIHYVSDPELDVEVSVNALTSFGRRHKMGPWDIWIHPEYKKYTEFLVHHEAIENYLRRRGWSYGDSHRYALRKDREAFRHDPLFVEMEEEFRHLGGRPHGGDDS